MSQLCCCVPLKPGVQSECRVFATSSSSADYPRLWAKKRVRVFVKYGDPLRKGTINAIAYQFVSQRVKKEILLCPSLVQATPYTCTGRRYYVVCLECSGAGNFGNILIKLYLIRNARSLFVANISKHEASCCSRHEMYYLQPITLRKYNSRRFNSVAFASKKSCVFSLSAGTHCTVFARVSVAQQT